MYNDTEIPTEVVESGLQALGFSENQAQFILSICTIPLQNSTKMLATIKDSLAVGLSIELSTYILNKRQDPRCVQQKLDYLSSEEQEVFDSVIELLNFNRQYNYFFCGEA